MVRGRKERGRRKGGEKCCPLNTVRIYSKKETDREREEMRFVRVERATCGLTLTHLGCQSAGRRGYLPPPGPLPAALMNLPRPWEWLMHLFM